jgi:hypothetical protein
VQWAERDSNPLRFAACFEGSGAKRRRKRHTGGGVRSARRARCGGTRRGEAGAGFVRAGRVRGHTGRRGGSGAGRRGAGGQAGGKATGPPWRRKHALGPTEELAGAIEFVSGGCHRCHRYRNRQLGIPLLTLRPTSAAHVLTQQFPHRLKGRVGGAVNAVKSMSCRSGLNGRAT